MPRQRKQKPLLPPLQRHPNYIEGSFWPGNNGEIQIKAVLSSVQGQILASEHINISKHKIDPQWLELQENVNFTNALDTLSNNDSRLSIELLTQRGLNNLSFQKGEEILFLVKANKNVYLKIFRPVPLKSCLFSDIYAASLNSTSFFSNHALLSLFLLIAVIDARAIEPFFDQLIPLFF